jgi:serine/threonine protein phosphatase 1
MKPIYAVGDLHGFSDQLERALAIIEADGGKDETVVFLGDYCDRGPGTKQVIQRLMEGQAAGRNWITLKGNHDRMFEWFMERPPRHDPHMLVGFHWFHDKIGGRETLESYGVRIDDVERLKNVHEKAMEAVPQAHVEFLRNLDLTFETDDLFFCHAGIRPGVPLSQQTEEDLVWIRGEFHNYDGPHPKLIVHGHTPVRAATHYGNRINLDSGGGYGQPCSVAVFEDGHCYQLTGGGRMLLEPKWEAA